MPETPFPKPSTPQSPPTRDDIRAQAQELWAARQAAEADCGLIIDANGKTHPLLTQKFLAAEQAVYDYAVDHYDDLTDLDWVQEIYAIHVNDPGTDEDFELPQAGSDDELRDLAIRIARPGDLIHNGDTVELRFSVNDTIRRSLEHILNNGPADGFNGPNGIDAPGL